LNDWWKGGKKMEKSSCQFRTSFFISGILLFILLQGCLPISKQLRAQADRTLTFQQVFQNPETYKGRIVIWGGDIIETINQKDGTTLIVVLQRPLDWTEEPEFRRSEGRFIILVEGYVDPYVFKRGRRITIAGEILGKKIMRLGELEYPYPLVRSKQIYLWGEYYYYPYPYPYYPWPYGYYGPWWGYPYW
jgi:outer membrane lipoprotein